MYFLELKISKSSKFRIFILNSILAYKLDIKATFYSKKV